MGWRAYGEVEQKEPMLFTFLVGLFTGAIAFPANIGWILISLGLIPPSKLFYASLVLGIALGFYFVALERRAHG